ncbi:MAG: DNA polymerase/3'-5' exonuclease PolX [Pirellulales bacterium]|nr:DNA polymerase/3'-5' exonuclease PolX [Pirellulales bacterium]
MNNAQIAAVFDEIADILEFQGANTFRVRAYRNGARVVGDLGEPLAKIAADTDRKLTDIDGIGKDLAEKIASLLETGQEPFHQELIAAVPKSVLAVMRVPGLGPKKAAALYRELKVESLDQLRAACEAHRVRELKGFGEKTEQMILSGLEIAGAADLRIYWAEADGVVQSLKEFLASCPAVRQVEAAGSYRRGRDTVGDLDFLVDSAQPDQVMDHLATCPGIENIIARGDTKMSVRLESGLQVDLRVVPAESWGAALQYFTGSKAHNVILRGRAKAEGLKINEYGVYRGEEQIAGRTEQEVYAAMGLPCFPPELREARKEFDWAAAGELPKLIELDDLRGDLHMHTNATDGKATLEQMVVAARERGLEYIAITDHSKRVSMANGLDATRLRQQWAAIDRLNERTAGIRVLKGIEVDILERGGLDLDDDVLAEADWVVASVHYGQNQPSAQITARIVGALENPYVSAIAHPTGRLINRRKAYEVDLETVFKAAAQHGKLLELNSNPARLDLDDVACAAAKSHDIRIVISTDAHSTEGLGVLRYGVLQARRAGLTKKDVANTRSWPELKKLIGKKR